MNIEQIVFLAILAGTLVLFVSERIRIDVAAMMTLLALALRAQPPRRLPPAGALALIGLGIHVAVAATYGILTLPFSGSVAFPAASAAAMMTAAALVIWASRVPIDTDDHGNGNGNGGGGPDDRDPRDLPPSSAIEWDALERSLHELVERPREPIPA